MGKKFKVAYCLGFFGFLRLSNLVPHTVHYFLILKHLCKGDVFFKETILLKWTMQSNNKAKLLKIALLNNEFCLVRALRECIKIVPGGNNAPLLQFQLYQKWIPLTDARVWKHLKNVLILVQKPSDFITFHSFRRSGTSLAFNHNVPLQDIQRHGTWTSDYVLHYVMDSVDCGSNVAATFATLFL